MYDHPPVYRVLFRDVDFLGGVVYDGAGSSCE